MFQPFHDKVVSENGSVIKKSSPGICCVCFLYVVTNDCSLLIGLTLFNCYASLLDVIVLHNTALMFIITYDYICQAIVTMP